MEIEVGDEILAAHCLRNMIAVDVRPVEEATEDQLRALAAQNAAYLLAKVFGLPSEISDEGRLVTLPIRQTFPIPRMRKIPAERPKTRWEKFAQEQNIRDKKRSRMIWDDAIKDWVPRWGAGSAKHSKQKAEEAVIEMKPGEDFKTLIENRRSEGKVAKKKQEFREIRNKVEAAGGKMPRGNADAGVAALGKDDRKKGKTTLEEMSRRAATSTASFGRHDKLVDGSNRKVKKTIGKKDRKKKART